MNNDLLKNKRLELGLTLEQVADYIGVAKSTVRKWENGLIQNMRRDKIQSLAEVLKISPLEIVGVEDFETNNKHNVFSPRGAKHIKRYEVLDDEGKDAVDYATEREERRINIHPMERRAPLSVSLQGVSAGTGTYLYPDDFRTIQVKESLLPYGVKFAVPIEGDSMEPQFHDGQIALVGEEYAEEGEIGIFAVNGDGYIKELRGDHLHSLNPHYEDILFDCETIHPIGKIIGVLDSVDIEE